MIELLILCRYFLINNKINQACSFYGQLYREHITEIDNSYGSYVYNEENSELSKSAIISSIKKQMLMIELKGLKSLIEIIESHKHILNSLLTKEEILKTCSRMNLAIRCLLFEGKEPIFNIPLDTKKAYDKYLEETSESKIRNEEFQIIREKWVGKLFLIDIDRGIISNDIDSVWELLNEFNRREFTHYINNKDEIKDILAKIGELACYSPDLMANLIKA